MFVIPEDKPKPVYKATGRQKLTAVSGKARVAKIIGRGGQCVVLAQRAGFNIHVGAARNWPRAAALAGYSVNRTPTPGSVFVTNESSYGTSSGHVGIILRVEGDWLYVKESNYVKMTLSEGWLNMNKVIAIVHKV